ncbi:MAG: transglutaminase domain-containing protein [Lachnospiraceae bacterium]
MEYYFLKLNHQEQKYYRKIIEAIECEESSVQLKALSKGDSLKKIVNAIKYDHPELFYVNFRNLSYLTTQVDVIYQIHYYTKPVLRKKAIRDLEKKIKLVLEKAYIANLRSDFEKCRWIHNYFVRNICYHFDALRYPDNFPESFNIEGVFKNRTAVCEGIAKAFKLLCDRLGVDALVAIGEALPENVVNAVNIGESHAWNIVRLNGEYTHIDVTWDIGASEFSKYTRFDYFCMPDRWMRLDHVYEDFPKCDTDRYSYFQKTGRCFLKSEQLQNYLERELKQKKTILYFKVCNKRADAEELQIRIQEQVNKVISIYSSSYYIEMIHNKKQMCFFFRIKYNYFN